MIQFVPRRNMLCQGYKYNKLVNYPPKQLIAVYNEKYITHMNAFLYTWVRVSWIEFNNCQTRCDLFSLLHLCRQLYMFRVLTPIIRTLYNYNYSFWYWLTGSTTICFRCWGSTQQRKRMAVDPVNQYQKLYLQLYKLLMTGVNTRNM